MKPLYSERSLGDRLDDDTLRQFFFYHQSSQHAKGGGKGKRVKPSQRLAMPEFFDFFNSSEQHNFSDLKRLPERRALVPMLLLAALIQPSFEDAVKRLVARLGDWCDASIAPVKGYARCLIKLYADYYHLPSPRSQWILDCLRCLLTGPSPAALHAIIAAISEEFGGVVQIKNPFELAEEDQEARCFLLLINITVVFDVGKTIGELATGPAAEQVFADFKLATSLPQLE